MRLNRDAPADKPSVSHTSTPAILWIMAEVVIFYRDPGSRDARAARVARHDLRPDRPDHRRPPPGRGRGGFPGVRDYMLKYMGQMFVSGVFGPAAGHVMGVLVSIVFGILLLSAVNTAIGALISTQYLMARDNELPSIFRRLNALACRRGASSSRRSSRCSSCSR